MLANEVYLSIVRAVYAFISPADDVPVHRLSLHCGVIGLHTPDGFYVPYRDKKFLGP